MLQQKSETLTLTGYSSREHAAEGEVSQKPGIHVSGIYPRRRNPGAHEFDPRLKDALS
jgi:hypothetical protein